MINERTDRPTPRCIFHFPNVLRTKSVSGSQVRPKAMINAFMNLGYSVDIVAGSAPLRRQKIEWIKENINRGIVYDFMYSESSTTPTNFLGKKYLLRYIDLDFSFFSFCKRHGIPIGLFYRDIYWRFPEHFRQWSKTKYFISQIAYKYDLVRYGKLIDILYLPSCQMREYFKESRLKERIDILPPGADSFREIASVKEDISGADQNCKGGIISLIYVGGIGSHYQFHKLLEAIRDLSFVYLTICCREMEWKQNKAEYETYLTHRTQVVHVSGEELGKYYLNATIGVSYFSNNPYMAMAMPVKVFEYMAYSLPIICTENTEAGRFVVDNDIGWALPYEQNALRVLLTRLHYNNEELCQKRRNSIEVLQENTWEKRAEKVRIQLSNLT